MNPKFKDRAGIALAAVTLSLAICQLWLVFGVRQMSALSRATQHAVIAEITWLREASLAASDAGRQEVAKLRDEVDVAAQGVAEAAADARIEAERHAENLARALSRKRRRQQAAVEGELSSVRAVTSAAQETLRDLGAEIRDVRWEAARFAVPPAWRVSEAWHERSHVKERLAIFNRAIGNWKAARARERIGFDLARASAPQYVSAGVAMRLRRTDPARHTYSLDLYAGAQRLEQNNRSVNEPVLFYFSDSAREPYELVVREVSRDRVRGYLVPPASETSRN